MKSLNFEQMEVIEGGNKPGYAPCGQALFWGAYIGGLIGSGVGAAIGAGLVALRSLIFINQMNAIVGFQK